MNGGAYGPADIKQLIEQSLDADKAQNVEIIDLKGQSALADYLIIASGTSSRHVQTLAQKIMQKLEIKGMPDIHVEGVAQGDWVVVDAGDVIVHLFRPEVRTFYNIEKMWRMTTAHPFELVRGQPAHAGA